MVPYCSDGFVVSKNFSSRRIFFKFYLFMALVTEFGEECSCNTGLLTVWYHTGTWSMSLTWTTYHTLGYPYGKILVMLERQTRVLLKIWHNSLRVYFAQSFPLLSVSFPFDFGVRKMPIETSFYRRRLWEGAVRCWSKLRSQKSLSRKILRNALHRTSDFSCITKKIQVSRVSRLPLVFMSKRTHFFSWRTPKWS